MKHLDKSLLVIVLTLQYVQGYGSIEFPSIRAEGNQVDIIVGSHRFENGWILDSTKNPDILRIPGRWPYITKKVGFITDIDSLVFLAEPGTHYDFMVRLEEVKCHIRVEMAPLPQFTSPYILILIALFFISGLFWSRNLNPTRCLFYCGLLAPLLFWALTCVVSYLIPNYRSIEHTISALGRVGTKTEVYVSIGMSLVSVSCFLFSLALLRISKSLGVSTVPAYCSFGLVLLFIWAAIFPLGNELHALTGPVPILTIAGAFYQAASWKNQDMDQIRKISFISALIMILLVFKFNRAFSESIEGLLQRIFYLGWSLWYIGLAITLSAKNVRKIKPNQDRG